jgi:1-pyrroline-5-carboxylate dehydrogenase
METELFGPVMTIFVYEDAKWEETLELLDATSPYALTGAVFSQDRYAIEVATVKYKMLPVTISMTNQQVLS